ncbi:hypothetical protein CHARACLAT_030602, partial [Characodon lateralis]|nr:hypothetical protein [Characodon lateralis]
DYARKDQLCPAPRYDSSGHAHTQQTLAFCTVYQRMSPYCDQMIGKVILHRLHPEME